MMPTSPIEPRPTSLEFSPTTGTPRRKRRWQTRALYIILGISVVVYMISQSGVSVTIPQASRSEEDEKMVSTATHFGGGIRSKGILPGWEGWVYPEAIEISFYEVAPGAGLDENCLAKFVEDAGRGPTSLYLNQPKIAGSSLRKLGGMTRLTDFTLGSTRRRRGDVTEANSGDPTASFSGPEIQVGRDDLAALCRLPKLRMLSLDGVEFSADAFRGLPASKSVEILSLNHSEVPDDALADLASAFPMVQNLGLANSGISDSALTRLSSMKELRFLSIGSNSALTVKGLKALEKVPLLNFLDASGSLFVASDFAELREAKPDLTIVLDGFKTLKPAGSQR